MIDKKILKNGIIAYKTYSKYSNSYIIEFKNKDLYNLGEYNQTKDFFTSNVLGINTKDLTIILDFLKTEVIK